MRKRSLVRAVMGAVIAVAATLAADPATAGRGATDTVAPSSVHVTFHRVATGLAQPVLVTAAEDGTSRLYVVEQHGTVRIVTAGSVHAGAYLDIRSKVACCDERGLLSIAFHPGFTKHPYVYAAYTRSSDGALQVSRFTATSATATHLSARTEQKILTVPHAQAQNHNGGQLLFGQSGLLYVSTGDGGGQNDDRGHAEDLTSLSAKILRLDVDRQCGSRHYCVPSQNPFAKSSNANKRLVFDWGLRNPWRMSFDRGTGSLWIGDVGQDSYEEIDHVRPVGGKDFGWSCREGTHSFKPGNCTIGGKPRHLTGPIAQYGHSSANGVTRCAVIGGFAYHGPTYAFAHGLYVFGDYCSGELWAVGPKPSGGWAMAKVGDVGSTYSITGFGEGDHGEIYAVTQSGRLYHLVFRKA